MTSLQAILEQDTKPALFIGNGVNRYDGLGDSSWEALLGELADASNVHLTKAEIKEMSNTEYYDILNLASREIRQAALAQKFCDLMETWKPAPTHHRLMDWAQRHDAPVLTVNFDENLSRAAGVEIQRNAHRFTDFYPWGCSYGTRPASNPSAEFGIWHPHGTRHYARSVRLGLRDYMGAVQRVRRRLYGDKDSLMAHLKVGSSWWGSDTWLDIIFNRPILFFGFSFGQEESFMRWLFIERARLFNRAKRDAPPLWFVEPRNEKSTARGKFFHYLGIEYVIVEDYSDLYEAPSWAS